MNLDDEHADIQSCLQLMVIFLYRHLTISSTIFEHPSDT